MEAAFLKGLRCQKKSKDAAPSSREEGWLWMVLLQPSTALAA